MLEKEMQLYNQTKNDILKLQKQIHIISMLMYDYDRPQIGEEFLVKYDIKEVWDDYYYMVSCTLFHLENFCNSMVSCIKYIQIMDLLPQKEISFIPLPYNTSIQISANFESAVASFSRLIEQPFPDCIMKNVSSNISKRYFPINIINRKNIDGLYWEINILRNRVVHPNEYKFENNDKSKQSYKYASYKALPIIFEYNPINNSKLKTTLISLEESPLIKEVIKQEIIKKQNENNIINVIFQDNKPKYKNNIGIKIQFGNYINCFDYLNSFSKFYYKISNYVEYINYIFLNERLQKNHDIENIKKMKYVYDSFEVRFIDIFEDSKLLLDFC